MELGIYSRVEYGKGRWGGGFDGKSKMNIRPYFLFLFWEGVDLEG